MWQTSRFRNKYKRRGRDGKRTPFHLKRVTAEIKLLRVGEWQIGASSGAPVFVARIILNDFSPKGLGLFSTQQLPIGEPVAITLQEPRRLYFKGVIAWCYELEAATPIHSSEKQYAYRVGIAFTFESMEEEEQVRKFCEFLHQEFLVPLPIAI